VDFEFSHEQEELRTTVRRFLVDRAPIRPYVREQLDDRRGTSVAVWKGLADLGATGLLVPQEWGGAGLGMLDMGVVLEEMGRAVHPGPFRSTAVLAVSAVLLAGSAGDHEALLPGLAAGDVTAAVAPDPTCFAATREGGEWAIRGRAAMVADAATADGLVAAAVAGGVPALFWIETGHDGVRMSDVPTTDGTSKWADVSLAGVPGRLLGAGGNTAASALANLADRAAVAESVDGVGAAEAALELAVAYAGERVQFDRPIGSFQAVQHLCADMLQRVEVARAASYYALWALDCAGDAERHRAATVALAAAAGSLPDVGASAIQVLGGIGFTWEHDAHLFYKRLLTLQQSGGGAPAQLEELARMILD
jgi:alkylation response protein AidB-like acyl-CoA dehydrogenase